MQFLYGNELQNELDVSPEKLEEFWTLRQTKSFAREFASELVTGISKHLSEIDGIIRESLDNYSFERITPVDRNILRVGSYEILFAEYIPAQAAINEAIEISKRLGGDDSPAFVNGILDQIYKSQDQD